MNACPECGHEMRIVKSMAIALCDQCGHNIPIQIKPTPKPPQPAVDVPALTRWLVLFAFSAMLGCVLFWNASRLPRPIANSEPTTPQETPPREYIGKLNEGFDYVLWKEGNCIIAKDLSSRDLDKLGLSLGGFKDLVKNASGIKCVLVE